MLSHVLQEESITWSDRVRARTHCIPTWPFLLGVLALAATAWVVLQNALPYLGHDEAVYAAKARSWLTDAPPSGWAPYRAPGMPALGYLALAVHNSVDSVRLVGLGLVLMTLAVIYMAAKDWTTPRRAVVIVVIVLAGPGFLRRLPEFLSDIGTAGMLVAVAYFLARAQQRPHGRDLLAVPFFALAAFYLRYGASAGLLALALAAVVAWGPRAWLARWRQLLGAAAIFCAGLLPHLIYSVHVTGTPLGAMLARGQARQGAYVGEGLVYYIEQFPIRLASPLGGLVMTAGILAGIFAGWRLARRRAQPTDPRTVFLALGAVTMLILLGLTAHGEQRYIFVSVILLSVLGIQAVAEWTGRRSSLVLGTAMMLALLSIPVVCGMLRIWLLDGPTQERESLVSVARHFGSSDHCLLVTYYQPELGWYSGCDTMSFGPAIAGQLPPDRVPSFVFFQRGKPSPAEQEVRKLARGGPIDTVELPTTGSLGKARILTLHQPVSSGPKR